MLMLCCKLVNQVRLGHQRAGHADIINRGLIDLLLHLFVDTVATRDDDRHGGLSGNLVGHLLEIGGVHLVLGEGAADLNGIDASRRQLAAEIEAVLMRDTLLEMVLTLHLDPYGKILADGTADDLIDLDGKPIAIFTASTIVVRAPVVVGSGKLMEQITVAGMNLHAIESGLLGAQGSCGKLVDYSKPHEK